MGFARSPSTVSGATSTRRGKFAINPQFAAATPFADGFAAVLPTDGKGWAFIDKAGKVAITSRFTFANPFSDGLAAVANGKWMYIDTTGKIAIDPQCENAFPFGDGLRRFLWAANGGLSTRKGR
jgi:hypothetical protein